MDAVFGAWDAVENALPFQDGPMAVPTRAAIGAGVGYLLMKAIRPGFAYNEDLTERPDAYFSALGGDKGPPTWTPVWTGPLLGALVGVALF